MENTPENPSRRYLYNPHLLSDEDLEKGFIVRRGIFDLMIRDLEATRESSPPPHHLIVGQRGMGKSTLLRRIGLELRRDPLRKRFVPLNFPEEQHVEVDCLSKFWLNCLDSLADTLEAEKSTEVADALDALIGKLNGLAGEEEESERRTRAAFEKQIRELGRRPVLLLDNFHLLLERLGDYDHHLRGFFSEPGAPILIGAAPTFPEHGRDHGKAFYDAFKPRVLHRLTLEEVREIIRGLAKGNSDVLNRLESHRPHLAALRDLTGGNPRTAHILYDLFASGFSDDVFENLTELIDGITPLYQSCLEQLSEQGQRIVGTLAMGMKPITAQEIAERGRLKRSSVSPQLGRLESMSFVERVPLHGTKKEGYQITERFFNIWYVLRFGSRRDRNRLRLLASFLKDLYTAEELGESARRLLSETSLTECRLELALSLPEVLEDTALAGELKAKATLEIVEKNQGILQEIGKLIDLDEIEPQVFEFAALKGKLREAVPAGAETPPEEFVDLVITTPSLLAGSRRSLNRDGIATTTLDAKRFKELEEKVRALRDNDSRWFRKTFLEDVETWDWLCQKLRLGQLTTFENSDQLEGILSEWKSPALVAMLANVPSGRVKNGYPVSLSRRMLDAWLTGDQEERNDLGFAGNVFKFWGWYTGALVAYRELTKRNPEDERAWIAMGNLLLDNLDRLSEAEEAYSRALEINQEAVNAWNGLAATLGRQPDRFNEAEKACREAIRLEPDGIYPQNNLGNILTLHRADYAAAEEAYRKAINGDPEHPLPHKNLAKLLQDHLGRYEESEAEYRKAIELDPEDSSAWCGLGDLLQNHLGRYEEAEAAYRKALQLDDENLTVWCVFGNLLYMHLGRYNEAEKAYRKAIKLDPENPHPWNALGNVLGDCLDRLPEAREAYLEALRRLPGNDTPRHNLAFLLRDRMNEPGEARKILAELKQPDEWEDTRRLHEALFAAYDDNRGIVADSLKASVEATGGRLPPETRDDWLRSAAVLLHLGLGDVAVSAFSEANVTEALLPFVEAIEAHTKGDRERLRNIIPEARPAAEKLFDEIERRRNLLPPR